MANKSGYYIKCDNCGKDIYQTKTQYNRAKHHFCSGKCQKDYQHKQSYENRECEYCGKIFYIRKKLPNRFCSTICQNQWQKTITGSKHPKYNRIACQCDYCGKDIYIIPKNYERFEHHFCGNECRQQWYASVYSQDEEWKEECRKRAINMLQRGLMPTVNTKPQLIINNLLQNLNIDYTNEYDCLYYSIDNYLYKYNLMIEVNGDFWHCNPIVYDVPLHEIQVKNVNRDKTKHDYIKETFGIEILYLWEFDIYNNLKLCKKLIQKYVESNGVLDAYHSFNYKLNDGNLVVDNNMNTFSLNYKNTA